MNNGYMPRFVPSGLMKTLLGFAVMVITLSLAGCLHAAWQANSPSARAAQSLIARVLPDHANAFVCETIPQQDGKDVFEIEARDGKIVLRGNDGVSIAMAFNTYLRDFARANYDWLAAGPLKVVGGLPLPKDKVVRTCAAKERFFLNYCTYGYTMPYWREDQWTRFVDWMAMNGINRPLLQCGLEATWLEVWKSYGIPEQEILAYFTGPAHLPWHRMANIDKLDGPLPMSYIEGQKLLQKKILAQARGLGMKSILSGFAGHVPEAWVKLNPKVKASQICWSSRCAYNTWFLSATEPKFAEIQERFLKKQAEMYGTDHLYGADPFNEMNPPSWAPDYLAGVAKTIYNSMAKADPEAVWYQMAWTFIYDHRWNRATMSAMTKAVPQGKMVYLDYACEETELYKTKTFHGAPFILCYLGNFGGNTHLVAPIHKVSARIETALNKAPDCIGVGSTLEGINVNPIIYDMTLDIPWQPGAKANLDAWVERYAATRAGRVDPAVSKAWKTLSDKVLLDSGVAIWGHGICYQVRPTFGRMGGWACPDIPYQQTSLLDAVRTLLAADPSCRKSDGYQYDVVNLTRQALGNYGNILRQKMAVAYNKKDILEFRALASRFMEVGRDITTLLRTRHEFLFGQYIRDARSWGVDGNEKDYYERNARKIVSIWGMPNNTLVEYASRQNDGMMESYYMPRWEEFLKRAEASLVENKPLDGGAFGSWSLAFERKWADATGCDFPVTPQGDPCETAARLFAKYEMDFPKPFGGVGWTPATTKAVFSESRWNIPVPPLKDGILKLRFQYESGAAAVEIKGVALLDSGKVVAEDNHLAWTGNDNRENVYSLKIPSDYAGKTLTLVATMRGADRNTDSTGSVFMDP